MNLQFLNFFTKFKPFLTWLKSVYSEADGTGSSTRVHIAVLIAFIVAVGSSFGVLVHRHTITMEQFDGFLSSGATFITVTCGTLYGVNKVGSWAEKKDGQPNGN